jgi:hypothetical protein
VSSSGGIPRIVRGLRARGRAYRTRCILSLSLCSRSVRVRVHTGAHRVGGLSGGREVGAGKLQRVGEELAVVAVAGPRAAERRLSARKPNFPFDTCPGHPTRHQGSEQQNHRCVVDASAAAGG